MRDRRGQAVLEMALVLPVLVLLLLGIISFGLYINANITVEQAARVGARAAAIGLAMGCPGDSALAQTASTPQQPLTIYGMVDDQINRGVGLSAPASPGKALLAPAPELKVQTADSTEDVVTVAVHYAYQPLLPIPGILPSTMSLDQSYSLMVQVPPAAGALTPVGNGSWDYVPSC